jgi:hypothetical protein
MVAARRRVDSRGASHFSHHDHQRGIEQAALRKVGDEGAEGPVGVREQILFETRKDRGMRIPAAVVDSHEPAARLHHPPSQQGALTQCGVAVRLADGFGLGVNIERFAGLGGGHQILSLLIIRSHASGRPFLPRESNCSCRPGVPAVFEAAFTSTCISRLRNQAAPGSTRLNGKFDP